MHENNCPSDNIGVLVCLSTTAAALLVIGAFKVLLLLRYTIDNYTHWELSIAM